MTDPAADGWTRLNEAWAANHDGTVIVGTGTRHGKTLAFVAVAPVPEPAALSLLAVAGTQVLRRRRESNGPV